MASLCGTADRQPQSLWNCQRPAMSAIGPQQTCAGALQMSAFGGKEDMAFCGANVRYYPKRTLDRVFPSAFYRRKESTHSFLRTDRKRTRTAIINANAAANLSR